MTFFHPKRWYRQYRAVGPRMFLRRRVAVARIAALRQVAGGPVGPAQSEVALDVLIPLAEKDLPVAPLTLAALRANLRHPLHEIVVAGQDSPAMRQLCAAEQCRFVLEQEALPLRKSDIDYVVEGRDRSGWIVQQLLKLSADKMCTQPNMLILDSDTLLLQPHCFIRDGQSVMLYSDEFHVPYLEAHQRLLGERICAPVSFVSHYMLMRAERLQSLRAELEARNGLPWAAAIVAQLDRRERSSFADYETYGHFALARWPETLWVEYWHNCAVSRARAGDVAGLARRLSRRYRSLSLHSYLQ